MNMSSSKMCLLAVSGDDTEIMLPDMTRGVDRFRGMAETDLRDNEEAGAQIIGGNDEVGDEQRYCQK